MNLHNSSKRRYSDLQDDAQRDQTFFLQNLATNTSIAFEPLSRLLRAHLPLSWLAPTSSIPCLSPASIFQGKIAYTSRWDYSVLVARHAPNGGLLVLEKFDDDCFVVHPLQPFVTDKWVEDASVGAVPSVCMQTMLHYIQDPAMITREELTPLNSPREVTLEKVPKSRRGAAARISILSHHDIGQDKLILSREAKHENVSEGQSNSQEPQTEQALLPQPAEDLAAVNTNVTDVTKTTEEDTSGFLSPAYLRQRYLEHLYKSKTSLSFYTKGPLSRARARSRAPDSSMPLVQLASFYRDSILPSKKMDLKYKDSLKEIVKSTPSMEHSSTDAQSKPRASRRTKLGKDGLWPNEGDYISEWWRSRVFKPKSSAEQQDAELRDALAALRIREAQMQIILILETLSIEAKAGTQDQNVAIVDLQADPEASKQQHQFTQPKSKTKLRNLESDLDVLADKLCIWHSVGLESAWNAVETSAVQPQQATAAESTDRLRTFCTDVLMTFYNAKLPLLCRSLCKTLAGSDVFEKFQKSSRIKEAASQSASTGKPIERRAPFLGARSLERVLSEGTGRHASPPTLLRSSTLPPAIQFKRESSDLNARPPSRASRQNSISLTKREVDLIADANATTSKRRKLELVAYAKREAEAAIQALKKPNRAGAGKTYMDEVEKRRLVSTKQAVQITATPRHNRTTSVVGEYEAAELPLLPSSESFIPASTMKKRGLSVVHPPPRSSATKRAVLAAIQNTPAKHLEHQHCLENDDIGILDTPVKRSQLLPELIFATLQKVKLSGPAVPNEFEQRQGSTTSEGNKFKVPAIALKTMERAMGDYTSQNTQSSSIYDTLGWNDDYEI